MKAFFNSIIHPGGNFPTNFNCNTLTRIFFPTQGSQPGNRMSLVFDSLANAKNPEFVIMSTRLNGDAKGIVSYFHSYLIAIENRESSIEMQLTDLQLDFRSAEVCENLQKPN